MKTTTYHTNFLTKPGLLSAWILLLLSWGLAPARAQYPQEVLNISAPTHSQQGTTGSWTVPAGEPYKVRITAKGARGGEGFCCGNPPFKGGSGATTVGDFLVGSGQVLEAIAGAPGLDDQGGSGGGGGSGVRVQGIGVLLIAGGGGGASIYFAGQPGYIMPAGSGNGGSTGTGTVYAGYGGGGLNSDGTNGAGGGFAANGGSGGGFYGDPGGGGYGGGGGGYNSGGGGGGYTGGNGGSIVFRAGLGYEAGGEGGSSYNVGSNQTNTAGDNYGGGQVIIENLGPASLTATATPIQPTCAAPTQGSVSLDLTGDFDGNTTDFEYALVAGGSFTGTPTFTDLTADPLVLTSGFGTTADTDGEIYTVRIRPKYNPDIFVDKTYTLTSPPLPTASIQGNGGAVCAGSNASFTLSGTSGATLTYTITGQSGSQTLLLNGSSQTITASGATSNVQLTLVSVSKDGCSQNLSSNSTVTVNPLPTVMAGPDQSVILGYGSNCTQITATADGGSGGTPPGSNYIYNWTPGNLSGPTVTVCPETTTTYSVTVTDGNGCPSLPAQVTVRVQDVRCGNKNQNVTICYYGVTQCVSEKIAQRYLKLGATLGGCGSSAARLNYEAETADVPLTLSLKAYPNPVQDVVTVQVLSPTAGWGTFEVLDVAGRVRQSRQEHLSEGLNEVKLRLGTLPTGVYLIRCVDEAGQQATVRVSRE